MGEFEPNDDGRSPVRSARRAAKLAKRLKPAHWSLLGEIARASAQEEDLQLFDDDMKQRGRTLAKLGYAQLNEEPGEIPGYEITASGKQALHDAEIKGWL